MSANDANDEDEFSPKAIYKKVRRARDEAFEQIVAKREAMEEAPAKAHDRAVDAFDYTFTDVRNLMPQVLEERNRKIEEAAREGKFISDWNSFYREIGETVREKAGIARPKEADRERDEVLEDMKKSRRGMSIEERRKAKG